MSASDMVYAISSILDNPEGIQKEEVEQLIA